MLKLVNPPPTGGRIPPTGFIGFNEYIFSLNVIKNTHRPWSNIVEAASPAAATVVVIIGASLCLILLLLIKHVKRQKFRILDEESLPHDCKLRLDQTTLPHDGKLGLDEETSSSLLIKRRPPNVPDIFSNLPTWRRLEESW